MPKRGRRAAKSPARNAMASTNPNRLTHYPHSPLHFYRVSNPMPRGELAGSLTSTIPTIPYRSLEESRLASWLSCVFISNVSSVGWSPASSLAPSRGENF
eukprot:scaffold21812_cov110-Isochrysis_galbana.AAC.4